MQSFVHRCPVVSTPFFEGIVLLGSFVINLLTISVWIYFWALYSVPLIYVSGFLPVTTLYPWKPAEAFPRAMLTWSLKVINILILNLQMDSLRKFVKKPVSSFMTEYKLSPLTSFPFRASFLLSYKDIPLTHPQLVCCPRI